MKFLIMGKPGRTPIPPEHAIGLLQAAKKWIDEHLANGRIDCHYHFLDGGGLSISNGDSHEDILDGLLTYPLYPFMSWEVKPLCEWKHSYDQYVKAYKRAAS